MTRILGIGKYGEFASFTMERLNAELLGELGVTFIARSHPEPEEVSQDSPRYVKGERVLHRRFGSGTITELSGRGRDLKVVISFDDEEVGTKKLLVAYAGLERDWETA